MTTNRKEQLQILLGRFGTCGCKDRCQVQEHVDENARNKPNGRFSVCELEADEHGIEIPTKEE